ncbi:MAG: DUF4381 domain-containing protein [Pseudomonadota bacterium]
MASPTVLDSNFGNYTIRGIEEIVFPPAVSWLPSTPAWKLLGMVLFVLIIIFLFKAAKTWRRNEYRRNAVRRIAEMRANVRSIEDGYWQQLSELPAVMKITALHAYPRELIASLSGQSWLDFLNESSGGHEFNESAADILAKLAYKPHAHQPFSLNDAENLLDVCDYWIRQHQAPIGVTAVD